MMDNENEVHIEEGASFYIRNRLVYWVRNTNVLRYQRMHNYDQAVLPV